MKYSIFCKPLHCNQWCKPSGFDSIFFLFNVVTSQITCGQSEQDVLQEICFRIELTAVWWTCTVGASAINTCSLQSLWCFLWICYWIWKGLGRNQFSILVMYKRRCKSSYKYIANWVCWKRHCSSWVLLRTT